MWTPVADMNVCWCEAGIGVMDGVLYAVGGNDGKDMFYRSVETYRPSDGVWTTIPDMHIVYCI